MKINQITQKKRVDEAGIVDKARALFTSDPALANLTYQQKLSALQSDTQIKQASKVALDQWQNKVVALMRANQNLPISTQEYQDNLSDFVEKTLLKVPLNRLDTNSQQTVATQMNAVMQNRDNKQTLPKAFNQLLIATTAARRQPSTQQQQQQQGTTPTTQTTTQPSMSPQQATQAMNQLINSLVGTQQQTAITSGISQLAGQPLTVQSTGNPMADALLKQFGVVVR